MQIIKKLFHRVLWQLNRSPLRFVVKKVLRHAHRDEVNRRMQLGQAIPKRLTSIACAEHLNREGYAVLTDIVDPALLAALETAALTKLAVAERAAVGQALRHKSFWTRLLDEDMQNGKLSMRSPYVAFATQPAIAEILAQAFGEMPFLDYVLLTLSQHTGKERSYSQLWHRDHDDVRVIKLFVYLTDVANGDDGPFTFIPGPVSDRYGYARHSHRDDDTIFVPGLATADDVKIMIAPKLSVFMVETSRCLHMGSRVAPNHQRLLYTATYLAVPSMFPGKICKFMQDAPFRDDVEQALLRI